MGMQFNLTLCQKLYTNDQKDYNHYVTTLIFLLKMFLQQKMHEINQTSKSDCLTEFAFSKFAATTQQEDARWHLLSVDVHKNLQNNWENCPNGNTVSKAKCICLVMMFFVLRFICLCGGNCICNCQVDGKHGLHETFTKFYYNIQKNYIEDTKNSCIVFSLRNYLLVFHSLDILP